MIISLNPSATRRDPFTGSQSLGSYERGWNPAYNPSLPHLDNALHLNDLAYELRSSTTVRQYALTLKGSKHLSAIIDAHSVEV